MKQERPLRIFNIMMCRKLGGIQQAFIDYSESLQACGHEVINITSKGAMINKKIDAAIQLPNLFSSCPLSILLLRIYIGKYKPDHVIVHGGRAAKFACAMKKQGVPVIGVTHNYSVKRILPCDYVLCITEDLKGYMQERDYPEERLFLVPNMIRVDREYVKPLLDNEELVIGAYGRFVHKKGFHDLIEAMKILVDSGKKVRLLLGGSGEEEDALRGATEERGLNNYVQFYGWVKDKADFFKKVDVFCVPSLHEPFGIVILEGILSSKPIVSTKSEGAMEILQHEQSALLAKKGDPQDIADKLVEMLDHREAAISYSQKAYAKMLAEYDIKQVGQKLSEILIGLKG